MAITPMTLDQKQMAQGLPEEHGSGVLKTPAFFHGLSGPVESFRVAVGTNPSNLGLVGHEPAASQLGPSLIGGPQDPG